MSTIDPSDRSHWLGGSDISSILGLSSFGGSPLKVFLAKTGQLDPSEDEISREQAKLFRRGKLLEPIVLQMLVDEHRVQLVKRSEPGHQNRYYDHFHPWMSAEIDAEIAVTPKLQAQFPQLEDLPVGEIVNVEVKTVHHFAAEQFGEDGSSDVPVQYAAQVMWGLGITNRKHCIVAALIGVDNLCLYHIRADAETIHGMREKACAFWYDHVMANDPPPPIRLEDVIRTLFRREVDTIIDADPELEGLVQELKLTRHAAKSCRERDEELRFQIGVRVLGADVVSTPSKTPKHVVYIDGQTALTVSYQKQNRIDADKLREEFPDVAVAVTKQNEFFSYNLPRGKKT